MRIGNEILRIRNLKGISQQELAKLANVSISTMSKIENGKVVPKVEILNRISNVLGLPLHALYFFASTKDDIPEEKRELYKKISPDLRELHEELLEAL